MEALHLKDTPPVKGRKTTITTKDGRLRELTNKAGKVAELNPERCIGCGVCAYKCQSQSLALARNQAEHHPPQTGRDWIMQFIGDTRATSQEVGK
jgi:ferredoxin